MKEYVGFIGQRQQMEKLELSGSLCCYVSHKLPYEVRLYLIYPVSCSVNLGTETASFM